MHLHIGFQLALFIGLLILVTPFLGCYIANIFQGQPTMSFLTGFFSRLETFTYRICNIDPQEEMKWTQYAQSLLLFNLFGFTLVFFLQVSQQWLPLNPQGFPAVPLDLAFNTAASFMTNTNWQAYAGETTMSDLTQMLGLTVQNFLSAATGNAVLFALIRGFLRKSQDTIGNFWSDLVKTIVYLLLPLSLIAAVVLISQGVIQTFHPYLEASTMEGEKQIIPLGPAASQIAIKQIGTNGGGFFNANSSHPFENPTPISNFIELFAIVLIPAASTYAYGLLIKWQRKGWNIFFVMLFIFLGGLGLSVYSELSIVNPVLNVFPVLEGIETRFGILNSIFWSTATSATSNGSVNVMLDSLSPLAGGTALYNMMLGEVVFGGVGVGLSKMIMYTLLTVFFSGLMFGRTPAYLGKKIEKKEIQWVMMAILIPACLILIGSGIACALPQVESGLGNQGPHGLTEIMYAFTSASTNNGSSFAGLKVNTIFLNLVLGFIMLAARLSILIPTLAIAGSFAKKKISPPFRGTLTTDSIVFAILLTSVIFIVSALIFFPALCLGPIMEHFLMLKGRSF